MKTSADSSRVAGRQDAGRAGESRRSAETGPAAQAAVPSSAGPIQAAIDASPRMQAQRRAIEAGFGTLGMLAAAPAESFAAQCRPVTALQRESRAVASTLSHAPPNAAVVQRVIVRSPKPGVYVDDSTGDDYALLKVSSNKKDQLYAKREALQTIRNLIFAASYLPVNVSNWQSVTDTLDSWEKGISKNDAARKKVDDALADLEVVWVSGDTETVYRFPEVAASVRDALRGVFVGKGDDWGHLTVSKPGFGERAPVARGTVTTNQTNGINKAKVRESLGLPASDWNQEKGRFKQVAFNGVADGPYRLASDAAADKVTATDQANDYFYVSSATRTGHTTSAAEGNYVLKNMSYRAVVDIPVNDAAIEASYNDLVVNRAVQDWKKVDRVGTRVGTQAQAMDGWNALGMAAYAKKRHGVTLDIGQDYEWLHIRGVQNGGANEIANLGAGTWIANSAMIPFENQIRQWADQKAGAIEARYEATTHGVDSPVLDTITIKVAASDDHAIGPIARDDPLTVVFDAQSGLLQDTFSNKIRIKGYHQQAGGLTYQQGVKAAAAGRAALANERHAEGHRHYLEGAMAARASQPAPLTRGGAVGHADYWAGVHAASTGANAATGAHAVGHADWLRGYAEGLVGRPVNFLHSGERLGHDAGMNDFRQKQSKTRKFDDVDEDRDHDDDDDPPKSDDDLTKRIRLDRSVATSFKNGAPVQGGTFIPNQ